MITMKKKEKYKAVCFCEYVCSGVGQGDKKSNGTDRGREGEPNKQTKITLFSLWSEYLKVPSPKKIYMLK